MKEKPIQESIDSLCSSIKNPQMRDIVRSCLTVLYQLLQTSDWAIPIHLQQKAKLKATGSISMSKYFYDDFWNSEHLHQSVPQQSNYQNWEAIKESFEKQVSIQFSELTSRVQGLESQIERQQALLMRIQAGDASFESSLQKSAKLREIEAMIEQLSRRLSSYAKKEKEIPYWGGSKKLSSGYVNTSELQISSFLRVIRPGTNAVKRSSLEPLVQNIKKKG